MMHQFPTLFSLALQYILIFVIWLNSSKVKEALFGSLSGPKFAIWTTKMDRSQTDFHDRFVFLSIFKRKHFCI